MASVSSLKPVEEEASCPICFENLTRPVTLDCGHNFCRSCINKYCEEWEWMGELECPVCKAKFQKGNFQPNWQLAGIVEAIKKCAQSPGEENLCLHHKEKLHLFCKEDSELVCFVCERSPEHKTHTVILKEEAAQEYKKQTKAEKEKMKTEFEQLHQFLEEQEKLLMAQMEEVEKEITKKREEHLARLSEELSSLGGLIREMEEKQKQPPGELLQDIRSTLQSRCEKKEPFQNPLAFPPELK